MLQLQLAMETGTTSAHAENTELLRISCPRTRNYLRARGEYSSQVALHRPDLGTTSAHAENTHAQITKHAGHRNYLRARGEYA